MIHEFYRSVFIIFWNFLKITLLNSNLILIHAEKLICKISTFWFLITVTLWPKLRSVLGNVQWTPESNVYFAMCIIMFALIINYIYNYTWSWITIQNCIKHTLTAHFCFFLMIFLPRFSDGIFFFRIIQYECRRPEMLSTAGQPLRGCRKVKNGSVRAKEMDSVW